MSAHTPGPWVAKVDDLVPERGAVYVEGPLGWEDQSVCETYRFSRDIQEDEANARLIAAAPDLLAALKDMASGWRYIRRVHGNLSGVGWDRAQSAAEAAIAAAEGDAPCEEYPDNGPTDPWQTSGPGRAP